MLKPGIVSFASIVFAALIIVSGCGTSGGSGSPASITAVSGSVIAAPVSGSAVIVKNAAGETIAGPVATADDGSYSVQVPASALAGDLRFEAVGGTYADEATGANTTAGTLAAFVSGGSLTGGSVHLDPASTIVHDLVTRHAKTSAEASAAFRSVFGFTPDTSLASQNAPSNGEDEPQRLKALRAAAFSQLTMDLGLAPDRQFELLAALADDLADDGQVNGSTGSAGGTPLPEDILNRFENSLVTRLSDTVRNLTGISEDKIGDLPMGNVALTSSYRVEYMHAGTMGATVGKTVFKVRIVRRSDNTAVPGLLTSGALKLMPMMHMPTSGHATPVGDIVDENNGTYDCTVYYLMASGPGMGFWEMKVMIGGPGGAEAATFHPPVGMAMGDTVRANLNGVADFDATGTKRSYMLFNDGLITGATSTFNLFIATKESMMNFVPVSSSTVLSSPTGTWAVDSAATTLQAATDSAFTASVPGIDNGNGHWSIPGISGLSTGGTTTLYVKFAVNNELKTAGTGTASPGYATFVVTPAAPAL